VKGRKTVRGKRKVRKRLLRKRKRKPISFKPKSHQHIKRKSARSFFKKKPKSHAKKEEHVVPVKIMPSDSKLVTSVKSIKGDRSSVIITNPDRLYGMIKARGKISLNEAARAFKIDVKKIEEWGDILEDHGLIKLHYPAFGKVMMYYKEKRKPVKTKIGEKPKKKDPNKRKKVFMLLLVAIIAAIFSWNFFFKSTSGFVMPQIDFDRNLIGPVVIVIAAALLVIMMVKNRKRIKIKWKPPKHLKKIKPKHKHRKRSDKREMLTILLLVLLAAVLLVGMWIRMGVRFAMPKLSLEGNFLIGTLIIIIAVVLLVVMMMKRGRKTKKRKGKIYGKR